MLTWFQRNAAVILTLVGLIGFSATHAEADQYKFTFSAPGFGTITNPSSIVLNVTGLVINSTVSGTGTNLLAGGVVSSTTVGGTTWGGAPALLSTTTKPWFSDVDNTNLVIAAGGVSYVFFHYTNSSSDSVATYNPRSGWDIQTLSTDSLVRVPSPVPGAGWLSWLLLGGFALSRRGATLDARLLARVIGAGKYALALAGVAARWLGFGAGGEQTA